MKTNIGLSAEHAEHVRTSITNNITQKLEEA